MATLFRWTKFAVALGAAAAVCALATAPAPPTPPPEFRRPTFDGRGRIVAWPGRDRRWIDAENVRLGLGRRAEEIGRLDEGRRP